MVEECQTRCRACGSQALTPVFSLGANANYVICDSDKDATACGLLQRAALPDDKVPEFYGPVVRTHRHRLRTAVTEAMEMVSTRDGAALDIGCGDGTLMSFYPRWIEAFGIDKVQPADQAKDWGNAVAGVFPEKQALKSLKKHNGDRKYDVITAISVLGEQQDPNSFMQAMKNLLTDDGVIVLETTYAALALMRNNVGAFHAQAQGVYTLAILENLVRQANLKIVRGCMSETEGGALRLFLTHATYTGHDYVPWLEQLARLWDEEYALSLTSRQTYQAFLQRVEMGRQNILGHLDDMRKYGEHIHVLGASPEMVALMAWLDLDHDLVSFIVSRDEAHQGQMMVIGQCASEVEVVSEKDSRLALPDYFLAPASRRREVLEHWREAIFEGAQILFVTPEYELVDEHSYGAELGKVLAITDGPGSVETLRAVLSTVHRPRLVAVNTAIGA